MGFVRLRISVIKSMRKAICVMALLSLNINIAWSQSTLKAGGEIAASHHLTNNEPLLLLLFGLFLFSVATGIKLKLLKGN